MLRDEIYYINIGSLSSYSNLYNTLGYSISSLRELILQKKIPQEIIWDFRFIERKRISIFALTHLISVAKNLRDYFGFPFKVIMKWDPYILSFLNDLNFIKIADYYNIFDWKEYIGGYESEQFNPHSKLFVFDYPSSIFNFDSKLQLDKWKEKYREEIELELKNEFENILLIRELERDYNIQLINKLISTTTELVVNTLLHGQETSIVGIQRTRKGISISFSDSGIGLKHGLGNYRKWARGIDLDPLLYIDVDMVNDVDALLNASLVKRNDVGLKSVINEIVNNLDGYVTMSSGISEIRWEKANWNMCCATYNYSDFNTKLQSAENILGKEKKGYLEKDDYHKGYYRNHKVKLRGTRMSFEVRFKTNYIRKY